MTAAYQWGDLITDPDPTWFVAIGAPDGSAAGHVAIENMPGGGTDLSAIGTYLAEIPAWGEPGFVDPDVGDDSEGWIALRTADGQGDVTVGYGAAGRTYAELNALATAATFQLGFDNDGQVFAISNALMNQLRLEAHSGQTVPLLLLSDENGDAVFSVGPDGTLDPPISGGGSFPDFSGSGSPEGVQTANAGQSYKDADAGALYSFLGVDGENTGWVIGAGVGLFDVAGFLVSSGAPGSPAVMALGSGNSAYFGDLEGLNGSGNALRWNATHGADGTQTLDLTLGAGNKNWTWNADGSTSFPGPLVASDEFFKLFAPQHNSIALTDAVAVEGSGNGFYFFGYDGADGDQRASMVLGPTGEFLWRWNADGSTQFPGPLGVNGVTPPAQAAHPAVLADVIAILTDVGLCAA